VAADASPELILRIFELRRELSQAVRQDPARGGGQPRDFPAGWLTRAAHPRPRESPAPDRSGALAGESLLLAVFPGDDDAGRPARAVSTFQNLLADAQVPQPAEAASPVSTMSAFPVRLIFRPGHGEPGSPCYGKSHADARIRAMRTRGHNPPGRRRGRLVFAVGQV